MFAVNVFEADGSTLLPNRWLVGGPGGYCEITDGTSADTLNDNGVGGPAGGHAITQAQHQAFLAD